MFGLQDTRVTNEQQYGDIWWVYYVSFGCFKSHNTLPAPTTSIQ